MKYHLFAAIAATTLAFAIPASAQMADETAKTGAKTGATMQTENSKPMTSNSMTRDSTQHDGMMSGDTAMHNKTMAMKSKKSKKTMSDSSMSGNKPMTEDQMKSDSMKH